MFLSLDFLANIGVAWFAAGVIAPFFVTKKFVDILASGLWGLLFAIISLGFSLWIFRVK